MDWYRWWHGTSTDPKFQMVAKDCGIPLSCVLGLWSVMLEQASANNSRGSFKFNPEVLEFHLGMDVVTPCNAMKRRGLLHETDETLHVVNWEKRQPKRERDDNSTERVRHCRERKKENETPCNATQRQVTPRGEEIREEVNNISTNVDKDKQVCPPCPIEEIISIYHETLPTSPQVRVRTPARDKQIKARWKQFYQEGDFKDSEGGVACFRWFFDQVRQSRFLTGQTDKPFFADLEWLTKASNFAKVVEGKYGNR